MKTTVKPVLDWCLVAAAGILLSACSPTHVGESWQCPLAQGTSCTTIAEADPAVPAVAAGAAVLFGEPLHRARRQMDGMAVEDVCDGGCGPFAWLRELLGPDGEASGTDLAPEAPVPPARTGPASGQDGEVPSTVPASLRTPEVLGRIWIAPFVDADGIYREAHWVRVVLEPAGWKLP